ncbi:hypothetical protein CHH28_19005 [Bacterioplanes sanyensis]|uniref:Pilus assembly protein PilZ n=1 Tax=Bacterioplanes sanyensis TaxID=1249553 RepID=A0A222FNM1_9GAMM|nr:flagellar brake protein [Bacterioplanes sanyensis]ASP40627.1 hypothetical protein CHH28_19005 [Bacterioplanes sanyensis]
MTDENQEYTLTEPEDVYGALRKIVLMEAPVTVRIDGSETEYHSAITDTDFKSRSFFLDQVIPRDGNDHIRAGKRFSVECDARGIRIEFRATGRLKYQPSKERYRIELPEQVLYLQRRTAYRVMVPPAHDILVKVRMNDDEGDLLGNMIDLSSSGFKAVFKGHVKKRMDEQRDFPIVRIRFNREHTMDCSLEARHVVIDENGNTQCGFAFTMLSATAQRYVDRLITEFQWEERRMIEMEKEALDDE